MIKYLNIWKRVKIKTKITILYLSILLFLLILSFSIIAVLNANYTKREVGNSAVQTVEVLNGNLSFIFDNVTQFSNLIYFNENVQNALKNVSSHYIEPKNQRDIRKSIINILLSGDYISAVYIIDNYGNDYSSFKLAPKHFNGDKIYQSEWYKHLNEVNGNGFFMHGSEGVLEFRGKNDYLTYIREIRNQNTYEPLAILLLTIDTETIQSYFREVSDTYDSQFFIVDGMGNYIVSPTKNNDSISEYVKSHTLVKDAYQEAEIDNKHYMLTSKDMGFQDWRLVGLYEIDSIRAMAPYYTTIMICIMCLNVVAVGISSMLLTRLIFKPLEKMEKHMILVEEGTFSTIDLDDSQNEISNLKEIFNQMVEAMKELLLKVKEEEQIIAKNELNLLQAQINPHFLYNTLDAVSALALTEDYENCFKMTQALGSFYRNSLNSGMDVVTIKDELDCIKSYITILNIRHDGKIQVDYRVEEKIMDYHILKLLLQPIIENAIHHGIKPNNEHGKITVEIFEDDDEIIMMVSDDGIGMSEERIQEIMDGKTKTGKSGFGIYNLKQRISLYYGIKHPIMIHSELESGTEVTIRIKKMKEDI